MFYYPEVLQRRGGCLGTVWLAATCSSRLLRREYLGVDVPWACAAVAAFMIGRGGWEDPPPPAGAPPPRCSLYLAALLQLGLARVYGRQCRRLLEEAAQVLERLHRARPPPNLDLSPPRRPQLVTDAQALMTTLELAPDPFFGVMGPGLPSPPDLPQVQRLLEELPPPGPPLTVSPESITLREPEPLLLPALEEELPEVTARELQLLTEVEGELLPPVEEVPEVPAPPPPPALRPPEEPSLPPPPPPEAPPRRRRRPPAVDPQPQIPQELFRAQLLLPHIHCQDLVLLEPPPKRRRTPRELLRTPSCGWLPPELWELWGRCARPAPRPPPAPPELPSEVEVVRELEPSLPALPSSEVSLEVLEEEPRPRPPPPEERRPPPLPERPEPELPPSPLDAAALHRLVAAGAGRPGGAVLEELLPPHAPRSLAGRLFYLCLELCTAGWLRLEQAQPYGPIAVGPGPRGPPPPSPPSPPPLNPPPVSAPRILLAGHCADITAGRGGASPPSRRRHGGDDVIAVSRRRHHDGRPSPRLLPRR